MTFNWNEEKNRNVCQGSFGDWWLVVSFVDAADDVVAAVQAQHSTQQSLFSLYE